MKSTKLRTSGMVLIEPVAPVAPTFSICPRRWLPPEPRLPPARFRRCLRLWWHAQRSVIPGLHGQNRSKPPPSPRLRRRNRGTALETGAVRAVAVLVAVQAAAVAADRAAAVADRAVAVAVQAAAVAVAVQAVAVLVAVQAVAVAVAVQAAAVDRAVAKPCAPGMRPASNPFSLSAAPTRRAPVTGGVDGSAVARRWVGT